MCCSDVKLVADFHPRSSGWGGGEVDKKGVCIYSVEIFVDSNTLVSSSRPPPRRLINFTEDPLTI